MYVKYHFLFFFPPHSNLLRKFTMVNCFCPISIVVISGHASEEEVQYTHTPISEYHVSYSSATPKAVDKGKQKISEASQANEDSTQKENQRTNY